MVAVILDKGTMKKFGNATDAGRFLIGLGLGAKKQNNHLQRDQEVSLAMKYAIPYTTTKDFMDHLFDD